MYNKFLTTIYAKRDVIDQVLDHLRYSFRLDNKTNLLIFKRVGDDTIEMYCRYVDGITPSEIFFRAFDLDEMFKKVKFAKILKLGKLLINYYDNLENSIVPIDTSINKSVEVIGFLDSNLTKSEFDYASECLYHIVDTLKTQLKGKCVVTYKAPFDISKEIRQIDNKWTGSEYDSGIFKMLEKIQSYCRAAFLEHIKDALVDSNICSIEGYRNYARIIENEYSIVSDTFYESPDFKNNIKDYIHQLRKSSKELLENAQNISMSYDFTAISETYIQSIKFDNAKVQENMFPDMVFKFNNELKTKVFDYIKAIWSAVFNKKEEASLYDLFFERIAVNRKKIEVFDSETEADRELIKLEDQIPPEIRRKLYDLTNSKDKQEEESDIVNKPKTTKFKEKESDKQKQSDLENTEDRITFDQAMEEYANDYGYDISRNKDGSINSIKDARGNLVNINDFKHNVEVAYDDLLSSSERPTYQKETFTSTTIYDDELKPESYKQFHDRAATILAQLENIYNVIVKYDKTIKDKSLLITYIKSFLAKATTLPRGIQHSLLATTFLADPNVSFQYLLAVLDCQLEILQIFVEEDDYKVAKGRIKSVLNEYKDLSKYFEANIVNLKPSKNVDTVVEAYKNIPFLLAQKFRSYVRSKGWKFSPKNNLYYKGNLASLVDKFGKINMDVQNKLELELQQELDNFNKENNSNLKLEDIFAYKPKLEPINIVIERNPLSKLLFNNLDNMTGKKNLQFINTQLDNIEQDINRL